MILPDLFVDRRALMKGAAAFTLAQAMPAWVMSGTGGLPATLSGDEIKLSIGERQFGTGGHSAHAVAVNGTIPAALIRLKEGQHVRIAVTNSLKEDISIHWHGLIVPFQMDGVPGVSFPGIGADETFPYDFPVRQSGTCWYHSHSGMQEAMGLYGPIIIDPAEPDPVQSDREHVIVLADWTPVHPHRRLKRLKQMGGYYNRQRQTLRGANAVRCRRPNSGKSDGEIGGGQGQCDQRIVTCWLTRPVSAVLTGSKKCPALVRDGAFGRVSLQ
jgi:FtsP/CotA-like multicopper oxidase with cupredoxin domain